MVVSCVDRSEPFCDSPERDSDTFRSQRGIRVAGHRPFRHDLNKKNANNGCGMSEERSVRTDAAGLAASGEHAKATSHGLRG